MRAKNELDELLDNVELDLKDASDLREIGDAHDALLAAKRRLDEAIDTAVANGRSQAEVASRMGTSRQAVHKRLAKKAAKKVKKKVPAKKHEPLTTCSGSFSADTLAKPQQRVLAISLNGRIYQVVVTPEGDRFLADVPELGTVHTFVDSLDELDRNVREVIASATDSD